MLCPHCQVDLHMTERQGIEIDYCPKCRGVWLDRGELDKIIERSAQDAAPAAPAPAAPAPAAPPSQQPPPGAPYPAQPYAQQPYGQPPYPGQPYPGQRYDERYPPNDPRYHGKRRKKSFFEELFD